MTTTALASPGRLYTFVVIALATLVLGMTVTAIQGLEQVQAGKQPSSRAETTTRLASTPAGNTNQWGDQVRRQLPRWFGIAVTLGIVSLIAVPSHDASDQPLRKTEATANVAEITGLPLLANLFPGSPSSTPQPNEVGIRHRVHRGLVLAGEIVICLAILVSLYGCYQSDVAATFISNPLAAYVRTVQDLYSQLASIGSSAPVSA